MHPIAGCFFSRLTGRKIRDYHRKVRKEDEKILF